MSQETNMDEVRDEEAIPQTTEPEEEETEKAPKKIRISKCGVPRCKSNDKSLPKVSLHKIPLKKELQEEWVKNLGIKYKKSILVCSLHFNKSDFYPNKPGAKPVNRLKKSAIPSLLPVIVKTETVNSSNNEDRPIRSSKTKKVVKEMPAENEETEMVEENSGSRNDNLNNEPGCSATTENLTEERPVEIQGTETSNNNNSKKPTPNPPKRNWTGKQLFQGKYRIMTPTSIHPEEWTIDEKKIFYNVLRTHGDSNLSLIQNELPHRSIMEIRKLIEHHKKLAQIKWQTEENRKTDEIRSWIEIIEKINLFQQNGIQDIIPRVLKYIALFEKRSKESDIDLREAYNLLSELSYGRPTKELPQRTAYFIYQCLVRLAENLQRQDIEQTRDFLRQMQNFEDLLKQSRLSEDTLINPLHVPEQLLQMSSYDFLNANNSNNQ